MENKCGIVRKNNNFVIIKLFANNQDGYYGDIYESMDELLFEHEDCEVMYGYGIIDINTGYCPSEAYDWYDTIEEAEVFIKDNLI